MSTGVGSFVQRTLRKAGCPWKTVKVQSPLLSRSALSKLWSGRSQSMNEGHSNNPQQANDALETTAIDLPDAQPESEVPLLRTESQAEETEPLDSPPYTDGPSRVILANDGTKNCLALLLTERLVADLNEIDETRRKLEIVEKKYENIQREVNINQIFVNQSNDTIQVTESEEERNRTIREIQEREQTLLRDNEIKDSLEEEVRTESRNLRFMQDTSQAMLRHVFTEAELVSLPNPDTNDLCENEDEDDVGSETQDEICSSAQPLTIDDGNDAITLQFLHHQAVLAKLDEARRVYVELQNAFDNRNETIKMELQEFRRMVSEGLTKASETDFHLCCLNDLREQTTALIHAENSFYDVLAEAQGLGLLENTSDQGSNFVDDVDDGYSLSLEADMRAAPDRKFIDSWIDTIIRDDDIEQLKPENRDSDIWDAQSIGISESFSMCDRTGNSRHIARWQETCETQRQESERLRRGTMGP